MAAQASLKAELREGRGKGAARKLRAAGRVPAVLYGHGEETRTLSVDEREMQYLLTHVSVENTLVGLRVGGDAGAELRVLVRELQMHPYKPVILHVDFYQIHAGERVTVEVPVRLVGAPEGVKAGGILQQSMHMLEIRCLAEQIPDSIEADVTTLQMGESLHVSDLTLPAGIEMLTDEEGTLCTVTPPTVAALEEPAEEIVGVGGDVQPELIRRRPGDDEEADVT